ncbi:MAG: hypothetical protein OK442_00575 [Thaumarchaeota archaeon]|nr:hypothetical protein [Nitrososphaerota archaeon]
MMTTLVMVVAAAVSGVIIYHNLGNASSSIGIDPPPGGGEVSTSPDSTSANYTAAVAGQLAVAVRDAALPASGFNATGVTSTFTCAASPSGAYLALTNNGTGTAGVSYISITSAGVVSEFTPSEECDIGGLGSGSSTTFALFAPSSEVSPTPATGQDYTGVVGLSDGVSIPFAGAWQ